MVQRGLAAHSLRTSISALGFGPSSRNDPPLLFNKWNNANLSGRLGGGAKYEARRAEARGPIVRERAGVLVEGAASPSHQVRSLGKGCKLP